MSVFSLVSIHSQHCICMCVCDLSNVFIDRLKSNNAHMSNYKLAIKRQEERSVRIVRKKYVLNQNNVRIVFMKWYFETTIHHKCSVRRQTLIFGIENIYILRQRSRKPPIFFLTSFFERINLIRMHLN